MIEGQVRKMLDEGKRQEVIVLLEESLKTAESEDVLLRLGEFYFEDGERAKALNMFNAVLRLNAGNQKAATYVAMIRNVMDYFNKDLLNP